MPHPANDPRTIESTKADIVAVATRHPDRTSLARVLIHRLTMARQSNASPGIIAEYAKAYDLAMGSGNA